MDGPVKRSGKEVRALCLDIPSTRNALSIGALEELVSELEGADADPVVRVVVLTATGNVFSSGANLVELEDPIKIVRLGELVGNAVRRISELSKPVVCRVNGDAYGAGVALLTASDIVIADRAARFSIAEVRFALVPTVAAACCVRKVGLTVASDLLLTGRRFGAVEAARVGFLTEAVEREDLDRVVQSRVDELLSGDPTAIEATKRLTRALAGASLADSLEVADAYTLRKPIYQDDQC